MLEGVEGDPLAEETGTRKKRRVLVSGEGEEEVSRPKPEMEGHAKMSGVGNSGEVERKGTPRKELVLKKGKEELKDQGEGGRGGIDCKREKGNRQELNTRARMYKPARERG